MKSPLFVSSIELLAHATELFKEKNERKFKFVILHLANAVELILKDKLLVKGCSIYSAKNQNLTIGIWESFRDLSDKGINIIEKPVIELLVDDRNTLQHRFGFPNEETVYFYLSCIKDFFERFLREEYNTSLKEELTPYLSEDYLQLLGLVKNELDHLEKLKEVSIEMALLQISSDIEKISYEILKPYKETKDLRDTRIRSRLITPVMFSVNYLLLPLAENGVIDRDTYQELRSKYQIFRDFRNQISHGRIDKKVTRAALEKAYEHGIELLTYLRSGVEREIYTNECLDKSFGFLKPEVDSN